MQNYIDTLDHAIPITPEKGQTRIYADLETKRICSVSDDGDVTAYADDATAAKTTGTVFTGLIWPPQYTTEEAPSGSLGAVYFDTTLNKLMVRGVDGWEIVSSALPA